MLIRDYVRLNGTPVAQIDSGEVVSYLHFDHLGTPRQATDDSQAIVWRWDGDAFGSVLPDEDPDGNGTGVVVNLRFAGQYYDVESGLHYNYFRTYDPSTGRYLESDPLGLLGGFNTYAYALLNPLGLSDPNGLDVSGFEWLRCKIVGGGSEDCSDILEEFFENEAENMPSALADAGKDLAVEVLAKPALACSACVLECGFTAMVGETPEEMIQTFSEEVAMQRIEWVVAGTLGKEAAKQVSRRFDLLQLPGQVYDFATCQCRAFE